MNNDCGNFIKLFVNYIVILTYTQCFRSGFFSMDIPKIIKDKLKKLKTVYKFKAKKFDLK